ncbi:hypothetical protein MVLG_03347 [Microbotryum lychnidis-dioicae p1A1 Lamole]|uniref:Uncharacterized protein n=1 Tax=Microbotryum lychnidis-dioicae (strain p1A1 Lamole / MvSl-1064) TaxID=683840 RepID=U5H7X7_USTV1|nr:hypothetical protein MVLG_03347 [Microbotryum lychnidis-dioicae p1A1 Lamole]|eukprot:KDE06307.1 hypothetical protein MVLG_03347 [Microbotryum lychnidis-dioicae p1A1 Lamole]
MEALESFFNRVNTHLDSTGNRRVSPTTTAMTTAAAMTRAAALTNASGTLRVKSEHDDDDDAALDLRPTKKRRRSGKVLDVWRAQTAAALSAASSASDSSTTSSPTCGVVVVQQNRLGPLNLRPSSPMARIGKKEMNASLYWHLISLSAQASKFVTIGARTVEDVLSTITRRTSADAETRYENVVLASLAAIGARRSFHSSITGIMAPSLLSSPDELTTLALGERRDPACSSLIARAVETAERSGLFDDLEGTSMEVMNILRIATSAGASSASSSVTNKRPFTTNIVQNSHRLRLIDNMRKKGVGALVIAKHGDPTTRLAGRTLEGDTLLVFDAYDAVVMGKELVVQDEMLDIYGLEQAQMDYASPITRIEERTITSDACNKDAPAEWDDVQLDNIRQLRWLAKLRLQDPDLSSNVLQVFQHLFATVDERLRDLHDVRKMVRKTPHFFAVPLLTLVALVTEAERRASKDPTSIEGQRIVEGAQLRFLKWLRLFVQMIGLIGDSYADNHTRAIYVIKLDFLLTWIPLAILGAQHHALQTGPLKEAEFDFDSLRILHRALKLATTVYKSASPMEVKLSRALAEVGELHPPSTTTRPHEEGTDFSSSTQVRTASFASSVEVEPTFSAAEMVQRALRDLEGW